MRGIPIAIACVLLGCAKSSSSSEDDDRRKARVEVTVLLDPQGAVPPDAVTVTTASTPPNRRMVDTNGLHVAVVGVPDDGDLFDFLQSEVPGAEQAGSNATIVVTTRCLKDLLPVFERNLLYFWTVALVVGARCEGNPSARLGAAAWVEVGSASRVKIAFDRRTRAFLKVEPTP